MKKTLIALVFLCLFFFSCDKNTTESEPEPVIYSHIRGHIRHAVYGYPLRHVKLSSTTDPSYWGEASASGVYSHTYTDSGYKDIKFSCYGFIDSTLTFLLTAGDSLNIDINLRRNIPVAGHAFYNPGYPLSDTGLYETNPTTGCTDYPDSLVLWSQHLEKMGYGGAILDYEYYTVVINLAKPIIGGSLNLADTTRCFVDYRIIDGYPGFWTTDKYTTRLPGGSGFIYIYNYDPVNHTIEGTHSNITLMHETRQSCLIYNSIFIGHW